jgi:hypothetical protein
VTGEDGDALDVRHNSTQERDEARPYIEEALPAIDATFKPAVDEPIGLECGVGFQAASSERPSRTPQSRIRAVRLRVPR